MVRADWYRNGRRAAICLSVGLALSVPAEAAQGQSLRGSSSSLDRQNRVAEEHDYTYIRSSSQVDRFATAGYLVRVRSDRDFRLHDVSFPYTRPEVALFIQRLARQYRHACGEQLVVTSLTRPRSRQPSNASSRSVHPTGMAVDLRRSNNRACRSWIENVLLSLEGRGVLEATRERRPPHYHVALFPRQYAGYVKRMATESVAEATTRVVEVSPVEYRVRSGDSLWGIAERHGTTVERLKTANELRGSRIYAGQLLTLPGTR
jgi:LysM repeat protein